MAPLFFPALLGWVLGNAAQLQQRTLSSGFLYGCLILSAAAVLALLAVRSLPVSGRILLTLLVFSLLAFAGTGLRAAWFAGKALDPALEGRDIAVTGIVSAMPQHNEAGLRFRLEIESAHIESLAVRLPPHIYLGWYSGYFGDIGGGQPDPLQRQPATLVAGERWQMTVRLKAPHGGSNPFGFDYELWLWEQGLQATGYVRATARDRQPLRLLQTGSHPVERARQQVREQIFKRIPDRQYAGLIAALVVGDQNAIDRADWDVFRATGVAHLMSISGLHITMFAWIAALAIAWLWRRSAALCLWLPAASAALLGGVLLATVYALFSGWGIPSQRTVLMLATVGLLRLSGKQWPWPQVLLLACTVVVASDPWALLQAGFWLSFVAVGVLFATDRGSAGRPNSGGRVAKLGAHLQAMMREQWVITLALTPLTLLLFGQVSVVGLIANALAIPWVTLLVTPLSMLGVLLPVSWDLAQLAIAALTWYLKFLAGLPFAALSLAQAPVWAGAMGVVGGLLLTLHGPWPLRLLGLPLMLPVLLWQAPRPAEGEFQVLAADIGQGNAIIVQTTHHALVFDAGPRYSRESDAGHRVLVPLLRALDLPVDVLMLSHRDNDHTGGALAVLLMQARAQLISSIEDDHELQALRPSQRCVAGQHWRWDGVDFDVLQPRAQDYDAPARSNAMSCTLRISNGVRSALLAGDIEQAQEQRLVLEMSSAKVDLLRSDILLVPHHGSRFSSSAAFLDAVQPRIALVQAGYRNRFGHPAESVLVRYRERGIRVVDSPHCGAATWDSARPLDIVCQRNEGRRYWQHQAP